MRRTITSIKRRMLSMMVALVATLCVSSAYAQGKLTLLSGSKVDGSSESCAQLIDGVFATKWGQSFYNDNKPWIIFKASKAVVPTAYYLVTGNDTGGAPDRNWTTWKIYAANFASDEEATRESEAWVLIDSKVNYSLPAANIATEQLTFSEAPTTAYTHFRIEIEAINTFNEGVYSQMGEFGFGSPDDNVEVGYIPLAGNKTGGEGYDKMFDGFENTKWGYSSSEPGWAMFKTTRAITPTYYRLITGHDSGNYHNRGWKNFSIYGGKFNSAADAQADFDAHFKTEERAFETWTLIEKRTDIGTDVIPNENCAHVYFDLLTPCTAEYDYFLIIVDECVQAGNWCQMAEFTWGNPEIFLNNRNNLYDQYNAYDRNQIAYKGLFDEYDAALAELQAVEVPSGLNAATEKLDEIKSRIYDCVEAYKSYIAITEGLIRDIAAGKVSNAEGLAKLKAYVEDEIAPNETYPAGSYKYIIANRSLDINGIKEEATRLSWDIEDYVEISPAIEATYTLISGTDGFGDEDAGCLFDGDLTNKWCHMHEDPSYVIFMASEPIAPTFIRLFTSNDTKGNPGRNWKKWKIFGANFESEEAAVIDAPEWVVIDDQSDAKMPAENYKAVYRYLSNPSDTPYQYFKIEIYESAGQDRMQMTELTFGNTGNFRQMRSDYVEEFQAFYESIGESLVEKALVEEYEAKLNTLKRVATIEEMGNLYNELMALQPMIDESILAYEEYMAAIEELRYYVFDLDGVEFDIQTKYVGDEAIAPGDIYINGSYEYIIANCHLTTAEINKETERVLSLINAINLDIPVVLDGSGGHWGDGHYKQLVDNDLSTKWGGGIPEGGMYVIFKMLAPYAPFFYGLETGGDTQTYPGRNWKDWNIYAANFESDAQATRDAEGWVMIDHKKNIGQDRLKPTNNTTSYFGFTTEIPEDGYRYYMVEVLTAYSGGSVQMQELKFGSEDEFDAIRDEYVTELEDMLSEELVADAALIAQFQAYVEAVETAEDIEEMFVTYYEAKDFWNVVETSANVYARYMKAVADVHAYLDNTGLDESDALTTLRDYLEGEEEPSEETFPNGSYNYIVENHVLTDSAVYAEIEYLATLKAAAVAAGYVPGADITAMLKNPTFEKKSEGWDYDTAFVQNIATYGDVENGYYTGGECITTKFNASQTLTGLKNGVYLFELTAGFRASGDTLSFNHAAKIYANENENYIQTVREGYIPVEEAIDGENCQITGSNPDKKLYSEDGELLGYILWAHNGAARAAKAGRYNNAIVANVTDGTLTVGFTNPGTADMYDERVIVANARLTYLGEMAGEEAATGIDKSLASSVERANTLIAYEPSVDEDYAKKPNFSAAEREALAGAIAEVEAATTAEEKYALVSKFTGLFQNIYTTKFDYVTLMTAFIDVFEKWGAETDYMEESEQEEFLTYIYDVQDAWILGTYNSAEALAKAAELYEKYPDFLCLDLEKFTAAADEAITQSAPFTYDIVVDEATRFGLAGLYDTLTVDETILTFEYKSNAPFVPTICFANPTALPSNSLVLEDMGATEEWKRVYYNIQFACDGMFSNTKATGWGTAKDHWLLWSLAGTGEETASVRNVKIITRAEMDAAGGTVGVAQPTVDTTLQQEGIYTLSGVRVEKATRGLYIKNGRKVIVK